MLPASRSRSTRCRPRRRAAKLAARAPNGSRRGGGCRLERRSRSRPAAAGAGRHHLDGRRPRLDRAIAQSCLGVPYVWGGASRAGFDCSGLAMYCYAQIGISLPHNAAMQYASITHVAHGSEQPGDLIFFGYSAAASTTSASTSAAVP